MTGGGPVATQDHAFVLGCKGIGELFACRTNVNVLISHIAEVLLAEASFRLCVRGHRLWWRNRDASLLACQDLFAEWFIKACYQGIGWQPAPKGKGRMMTKTLI